jgi:hypothetical protein
MKPLSEHVVSPNEGETTTLSDLTDKPVGLARFFSRNAPWLKLRRRIKADLIPQAKAESSESVDSQGCERPF